MLVNVSRYKAVQQQVFELLGAEVSKTRAAIELHHADRTTQHSVIRRIRTCFDREFSRVGFKWNDVLPQLPNSVSDVRVMLFNSDTDKKLAQDETLWDRPPRIIAVGGDVLIPRLPLNALS